VRVSAGATVTVEIPVVFVNEDVSPGLKRGGVLNIVRREIELVCPADAIPGELTVDLRPFDIGDSVHISHVALPEGARPTIADRDFTIATISAPTVVAEEAEAAQAAEEEKKEAAEAEAPTESSSE
jgi:large subunit ribosomal protein L25